MTFKLYRIINNELIFVKSFTQVSIVATAIINVERERTAAGQLSSCALHSNGFSFRRNVFFFCFLYLFFSGRCLFYVFGCLCTHPLFFLKIFNKKYYFVFFEVGVIDTSSSSCLPRFNHQKSSHHRNILHETVRRRERERDRRDRRIITCRRVESRSKARSKLAFSTALDQVY